MEQQLIFSISLTVENKFCFTSDCISMIVDNYNEVDSLHYITNPATATAYLKCCESKYNVDNTMGFETIEAWFTEELLPKSQMLDLLLDNAKNLQTAG